MKTPTLRVCTRLSQNPQYRGIERRSLSPETRMEVARWLEFAEIAFSNPKETRRAVHLHRAL